MSSTINVDPKRRLTSGGSKMNKCICVWCGRVNKNQDGKDENQNCKLVSSFLVKKYKIFILLQM
jgi:hypothetical protein